MNRIEMELNSLARTLAQSIFHRKVTDDIRPDDCCYIAVKSEAEVEAMIREAIEKFAKRINIILLTND